MISILKSKLVLIAILSGIVAYPFLSQAISRAYGYDGEPRPSVSVEPSISESQPAPTDIAPFDPTAFEAFSTPTPQPSASPSATPTNTPTEDQSPSGTPEASPDQETPTPQQSAQEDGKETPQPSQVPQSSEPTSRAPQPPTVHVPPPELNPIAVVRGPGAYMVIVDGVLLGNFLFDPAFSRELLGQMRSPDCNLGDLCRAIIAPIDGVIDPGTPVKVSP